MENLRLNRIASNKNYRQIISGLVAVLLVGVIVNGCGDSSLTSTQPKNTKDQVLESAHRYGIDVKLTDKNSVNNNSPLNFRNAAEVDEFFKGLSVAKPMTIKRKVNIRKRKDGSRIAVINNSINYTPKRLKVTGPEGGLETARAWFYNLTWLEVTATWDSGMTNRELSINPVGVSVMSWDDPTYQTWTSGSKIHFEIHISGGLGFTWNGQSFNGLFHSSGSAEGWIDTETGETSLTTDGQW